MKTQEQHVLSIAKDIQEKQAEIKELRNKLGSAAVKAGKTKGEYDKQIAISLLKLNNGAVTEFEGIAIPSKLSASERERIARGLCSDYRIEAETSENLYSALINKIRAIQAELNGSQSIYRHLDET